MPSWGSQRACGFGCDSASTKDRGQQAALTFPDGWPQTFRSEKSDVDLLIAYTQSISIDEDALIHST
jgi:hypothetical protein